MKQKVAIYTRVSTQDQTTLNQRIRLEKYAELQGWKTEVFEETESSRKSNGSDEYSFEEIVGEYSGNYGVRE